MQYTFRLLIVLVLLFNSIVSFANSLGCSYCQNYCFPGPVAERARFDKNFFSNYFAISLYKPTYFLPYYYTGSPDNVAYQNTTPSNEPIKRSEVKYQISLKVPVWKNINCRALSLYFAYTQLSYWQLYNHSAFFRENNYEPEFFLSNEVNYHVCNDWYVNFFNPGLSHQSNGYGNGLQRGWDRFYIEAITSTNNWLFSVKPWAILYTNKNNRNIGNYLGYGQVLVSYKCNNQVISLMARNVLESAGRRAAAELTWSFPITPYLKGYAQVFSGYGQSLIEYNHRTNSAGIGIAFSDWV